MSRERDLHIATDKSTGRPILVAPQRRHRPMHTAGKALGPCPFCAGEEHQTPPEVAAVRDDPVDPTSWRVRAFANLYPAARLHDVIVEGSAHEVRPGAVPIEIWRDALTVFRARIVEFEADADVRCAFLFKNVGRDAGASIAHCHTQLLGLPMLPPRLELELLGARTHGCVHCDDLARAPAEQRIIFAGEHHVALSPTTPKLPHETWILPRAHGADLLDDDPVRTLDLARVMHAVFVAFDRHLDAVAFNLYLHRIPGADFHWHFELQPRTGYLAGLELGGDMYINSVSGIEAASRLRGELHGPAGGARR